MTDVKITVRDGDDKRTFKTRGYDGYGYGQTATNQALLKAIREVDAAYSLGLHIPECDW